MDNLIIDLFTFEKGDVSSAKILHNEFISSGRSCMYIKNKSDNSTDPSGSPDFSFPRSDVWPIKTTCCSRFSR